MVTLAQAIEAGLSARQVQGFLDSGKWLRLYQSVYADAAVPVTPMQPVRAAAFAMGEFALAAGPLACWLWQVTRTERAEVLEFAVAGGRSPRPTGIVVRRLNALPAVSIRRGIRVTSPLRALADLGASAPEQVPDALLNALLSRLVSPAAVQAEIERASAARRKGVSVLRRALADLGVGRYTPSQLEARARRLFKAAGLSHPEMELVFGDEGEYRLDFYWAAADLVVEVDGWSIHATPGARRRDYRKQNRIVIGDHWILRYDWYDVVHCVERTAAEVLEAYAARTALVLR